MKSRPLFPRKKKPKGRLESVVSAGVQAYLSTRNDLYCWRSNTGAAKYDDFYVAFGKKGAADIQGVQALLFGDLLVGRFFGIETKREIGGTVSEEQERWGANVTNHGGLYIVARGIEAVAEGLGPEQVRVTKLVKPRVYPR